MSVDPNIKLYVKEEDGKERDVSDKKYAPIITWTILLGILGLFGIAIVMQLIKLIGLPTS